MSRIPVIVNAGSKERIDAVVQENIALSTFDWDSFEESWDFQRHPLLKVSNNQWWNESDLTPRRHRIEDSFNF